MQFQPLALLALATYAIASPTPIPQSVDTPPTLGDPFGVGAVSTNGSKIQNQQLTASAGRIFIGGTQTPSCDRGERQDFATFVIYSDKTVYLYKTDNPPQQLWVDASGMGGGISGYTTGAQPTPKNASRGDFEIDEEGVLTFSGVGTKACPTGEEGKWTVWFTSNEKPGFQEDCLDVTLKAYDAPARVACTYEEAA